MYNLERKSLFARPVSNLNTLFLQVPRAVRAPHPLRLPGHPQHPPLQDDEGGGEKEREAAQLQDKGAKTTHHLPTISSTVVCQCATW